MKKFLVFLSSIIFVFSFSATASALLLSGVGSDGLVRDIIEAPEYITNDAPGVENFLQEAFNEEQNVLLASFISQLTLLKN